MMLKRKTLWSSLILAAALMIGTSITTYANETTEHTVESETSVAEQETEEAADVITVGAATADNTSAEESTADEASAEADAAETTGTEGSADSSAAEASSDTSTEETAHNHADNGLTSLGIFRTTGYCPCYQCSEGWGRHTSTGAIAKSSHTIAVDPRVIPYGSKIMINGVVYTAEDRGGGVKGNHIDIFFDTHSQTRQHGSRHQEVFLVS